MTVPLSLPLLVIRGRAGEPRWCSQVSLVATSWPYLDQHQSQSGRMCALKSVAQYMFYTQDVPVGYHSSLLLLLQWISNSCSLIVPLAEVTSVSWPLFSLLFALPRISAFFNFGWSRSTWKMNSGFNFIFPLGENSCTRVLSVGTWSHLWWHPSYFHAAV